jgi:hypothetical protein
LPVGVARTLYEWAVLGTKVIVEDWHIQHNIK